jgi:hypothetical protein
MALEDHYGMNPRSRAEMRLAFRREALTAAVINRMATDAQHDTDPELEALEGEYARA